MTLSINSGTPRKTKIMKRYILAIIQNKKRLYAIHLESGSQHYAFSWLFKKKKKKEKEIKEHGVTAADETVGISGKEPTSLGPPPAARRGRDGQHCHGHQEEGLLWQRQERLQPEEAHAASAHPRKWLSALPPLGSQRRCFSLTWGRRHGTVFLLRVPRSGGGGTDPSILTCGSGNCPCLVVDGVHLIRRFRVSDPIHI